MPRTKAWLLAVRLQTLSAAAAPVIVGAGFATHENGFEPFPALIAFVGIALIPETVERFDGVVGEAATAAG